MTTLVLENTFLRFVERVIIAFVIYGVFVALPFSDAKNIATALVTSILHYCNSIYATLL